MSDGLFFTGTIIESNRNIIAEEATRQQLAIQKEELEIRRQESAQRRKDARSKGVKAETYELAGMDPFLEGIFKSQVGDYQNFVNENGIAIYDGDVDLKNQKNAFERDLSSNQNLYTSLTNDLATLNEVVVQGRGNTLALAEDGETYLYQYNYNKIKEEVNSGNMTLNQALKAYPIDSTSMVKQSDFIPFYNNRDLYFENDDKNFRVVVGVDEDGYNITKIDPNRKKVTTSEIINKLKVNSNNKHNDSNAGVVYKNEQLIIDGVRVSAMEAFFKEAYEDPDTGVIGGIMFPDADLMEQLDPGSDKFNKELSDKYAEYLGKKIADRGYEDRDERRGNKAVTETQAEIKKREMQAEQDKYNVDTYNYMQNNKTKVELGYQVYTDKSIATENPQNNKADVRVDSLLGDVTEKMKEIADIARLQSNGMISMVVVGVTLDGSGQVVARVKHTDSGAEAYVPWNKVASKQIYDALRPEGKKLVDYRQPTLTTDGEGGKKPTPISGS